MSVKTSHLLDRDISMDVRDSDIQEEVLCMEGFIRSTFLVKSCTFH